MDYNVVLTDLPLSVKGFVRQEDDFYTVVLNSRLTHEANIQTCRHEERHIKENDFGKGNVQEIETSAHRRK